MGRHATAVPIVVDNLLGTVSFNHDHLSVFAWGAGKSASHKFEPSKEAPVDSSGVPVSVANRKNYENKRHESRTTLQVSILPEVADGGSEQKMSD